MLDLRSSGLGIGYGTHLVLSAGHSENWHPDLMQTMGGIILPSALHSAAYDWSSALTMACFCTSSLAELSKPSETQSCADISTMASVPEALTRSERSSQSALVPILGAEASTAMPSNNSACSSASCRAI